MERSNVHVLGSPQLQESGCGWVGGERASGFLPTAMRRRRPVSTHPWRLLIIGGARLLSSADSGNWGQKFRGICAGCVQPVYGAPVRLPPIKALDAALGPMKKTSVGLAEERSPTLRARSSARPWNCRYRSLPGASECRPGGRHSGHRDPRPACRPACRPPGRHGSAPRTTLRVAPILPHEYTSAPVPRPSQVVVVVVVTVVIMISTVRIFAIRTTMEPVLGISAARHWPAACRAAIVGPIYKKPLWNAASTKPSRSRSSSAGRAQAVAAGTPLPRRRIQPVAGLPASARPNDGGLNRRRGGLASNRLNPRAGTRLR